MLMTRHPSAPVPRLSRIRSLSAAVLVAGLFMAAGPVQAQSDNTRWVSDSLSTYVRSGPTDGYRIVGTLQSGQRVELVTSQGNYSQVRSESGSLVWIPSADLQEVPGQAERLPQLEQRVAELSAELGSINETWETRVQGMQETLDSRKALIEELEAMRSALNEELTATQSELRSAQARLGDENRGAMMDYMIYGGSIAGVGLLAGLILPTMFRRRKRNDGWV
ncbi:peptide-binding protein [Pseudomonas sp. WN033]|nr:peptide-binding protein [Pseudomonas sp. WN033]